MNRRSFLGGLFAAAMTPLVRALSPGRRVARVRAGVTPSFDNILDLGPPRSGNRGEIRYLTTEVVMEAGGIREIILGSKSFMHSYSELSYGDLARLGLMAVPIAGRVVDNGAVIGSFEIRAYAPPPR